MCSVDDIRERENYFVLLDDRDPEGNLSKRSVIDSYCLSMHCPYSPFQVYKLYINRRDWERTNYETDIRYIEHILNSGFLGEKAKTRFVLECDCRSMSLFYIRQAFFRRLMSSLRARYKNRLVKVDLSGSGNLWMLISYWLVRDAIPLSVQDKIEWG